MDFSNLFGEKSYISKKSQKQFEKEKKEKELLIIKNQKKKERKKQKKLEKKRKRELEEDLNPTQKKRKIDTEETPEEDVLHEGYKSIAIDSIKKTDDEDLLRKEVSAMLSGNLQLDDFDIDESEEVEEVTPQSIITVFVGGIPHEVTPSEVKTMFRQFGILKNIRPLGRHSEDRETYVCFIDFRGEEAAEKAIALNGTLFRRKVLDVRLANEERPTKLSIQKEKQNTTIFVKNLPGTVTQKKLRKLFIQFGKIKTMKLPLYQDSGNPKGFAFITFQNKSSLKSSISTPLQMDGWDISVEISTPK